MGNIFDFERESREDIENIQSCQRRINTIHEIQTKESEEISKLSSEIESIARAIGVSVEDILDKKNETELVKQFQWDDLFFLDYNLLIIESKIKKEVFKNPELLPSLSSLDYAIVGISGLVASLIDFLIVKVPQDINYLGKYRQEGSEFTQWLRSIGINEQDKLNPFLQWCENVCKVPYDRSIDPNIQGFNPKNHRLLSLGHDPLFGLIFGTLDIINGSMTAFDTKGNLQIFKTFDMSSSDRVFAPFIWLGHIVSDMCTKMGIPIPGWAFTQLLQFGSFNNNRNIAEISRWMYLNGYDLRHFLTMSVSASAIEIVVRAYHYVSYLDTPEKIQESLHSSITNKELNQIKSDLKLHKMLFLAHGIAASGNALKVFTYSGNPLAINLTQWLFFVKESVQIIQGMTRDKNPEIIIRNRHKINNEWQEIKNISINRFNLANSSIYYDYFKS